MSNATGAVSTSVRIECVRLLVGAAGLVGGSARGSSNPVLVFLSAFMWPLFADDNTRLPVLERGWASPLPVLDAFDANVTEPLLVWNKTARSPPLP